MPNKFAFMLWFITLAPIVTAEPTTRSSTQPADPYRQLAERMPETLSDPTIKSFDVIATIQSENMPLVTRLKQTESGKTSAYLEYGKRRVPFLFAIDREMFQFDPASGVLWRMHNVSASVTLESIHGRFSIKGGVAHSEKPTTRPMSTLEAKINFRSLMVEGDNDISIQSDGPIEVLTGHTKPHGYPAQFWIDPRLDFPLIALVLNTQGGPFCTFSRIEINRPVDETNMVMPADDQLKSATQISEVDKSFFNASKWEAGLVQSVLFEAALDDPKYRPSVEAKLGKIDWNARIKSEAATTAAIRKIIGEQLPVRTP